MLGAPDSPATWPCSFLSMTLWLGLADGLVGTVWGLRAPTLLGVPILLRAALVGCHAVAAFDDEEGWSPNGDTRAFGERASCPFDSALTAAVTAHDRLVLGAIRVFGRINVGTFMVRP